MDSIFIRRWIWHQGIPIFWVGEHLRSGESILSLGLAFIVHYVLMSIFFVNGYAFALEPQDAWIHWVNPWDLGAGNDRKVNGITFLYYK